MKKIPWVAALLNFIVPGAGYLYAGTRVKFGILLVSALALLAFGPTPEYAKTAEINPEMLIGDPAILVMAIATLMISGAFAYDAYTDTKKLSKSIKSDRQDF